jgi:hypothetical protein
MKFGLFTLSPFVKRVAGALSLGAGVLLIGQTLRSTAPREVEVRIPLAAFQGPSMQVRTIEVTFSRSGSAMRVFRQNLEATPRVWHHTFSLPEGAMEARVSLTLDQRILERESLVSISPGNIVELSPPTP